MNMKDLASGILLKRLIIFGDWLYLRNILESEDKNNKEKNL